MSATLPERSAAPVPMLVDGLTGSRSRMLRDSHHYLPGVPDAGRLSISAHCSVSW